MLPLQSGETRKGRPPQPGGGGRRVQEGKDLMTHKYRGSIVVLSISKSVEPNVEQKEMTSGFQQGNVCKFLMISKVYLRVHENFI